MRQYRDLRLIKRNNFLGKALTFSGLALLIGSLVLSFTRPEMMNQLLIAVIIGTMFSQVGIALNSRWGSSPRIDELFDNSLKGLDNRYATFHYKLGTSHALFSPSGVFALVPHHEDGEITYDDGMWSQKKQKAGIFRRSSRKPLKRIESSANAEVRALKRAINRALPKTPEITMHPILVFTNDNAFIKTENTPILTVHIKKLKSVIRRLPKAKALTDNEIELLAKAVGF
jgi:hypothetical protein